MPHQLALRAKECPAKEGTMCSPPPRLRALLTHRQGGGGRVQAGPPGSAAWLWACKGTCCLDRPCLGSWSSLAAP